MNFLPDRYKAFLIFTIISLMAIFSASFWSNLLSVLLSLFLLAALLAARPLWVTPARFFGWHEFLRCRTAARLISPQYSPRSRQRITAAGCCPGGAGPGERAAPGL